MIMLRITVDVNSDVEKMILKAMSRRNGDRKGSGEDRKRSEERRTNDDKDVESY